MVSSTSHTSHTENARRDEQGNKRTTPYSHVLLAYAVQPSAGDRDKGCRWAHK